MLPEIRKKTAFSNLEQIRIFQTAVRKLFGVVFTETAVLLYINTN